MPSSNKTNQLINRVLDWVIGSLLVGCLVSVLMWLIPLVILCLTLFKR